MSAPLVVNTKDGMCFTRRGVLRSGEALYALADVRSCPEIVMATLAELAEHGIAGTADVLPVPAGPVPVLVEDVSPQVRRLRSLLAGQREAVEGEHYSATHHDYRVGRDLPEAGGSR